MAEGGTLDPLLSALRDLMAWFESERTSGVVIGGVAVSLLARPRFTRDVDAVVWLEEDRWGSFLDAGQKPGRFAPETTGEAERVEKEVAS